MKTTAVLVLLVVILGAFFSCDPKQSPVQEEYVLTHTHTQFYTENIMKNHSVIMKDHVAFKK
jgi:hypothetical protein